ncbi:amino acid transporter [Gordonia sihwensis]|uniref:LysE/ArgO family amino acid transporter n=1 Tax=Gordonia sp. QH-12 TaxID=1437876 RepID=UPI000587CCB9|nr:MULTISPECIES: LysE family transporter [Gordonia]AUH70029.1 amino acid transporter [Gordonia sp. YC-JH1]KJR09507.1 amino acid transporter [Gordonia sihwensis]KXT58424.1 amino acid transporter [Gordonia sp. QH-12]MBY4568905.1 amino acid transporter [Gordonia sihwensis]
MSTYLLAALAGLVTGAGLIIAIGPQNIYVIRQGVSGAYVLPVIAVCVVSDIVLISAGTAGLGALVSAHPSAVAIAEFVGGGYLLVLAALAARRALRPGSGPAHSGSGRTVGLWAALGTALALTWLNPHTYLDTVLTLGSIANSHGGAKWSFTIGACTASLIWFLMLGLGARRMAPVFASARAWRVLDTAIAAVMAALGVMLIAGA